MKETLLLNATYEPIMIITWRRAVTLVYAGKSEVLEEYQREIKSTSMSMRVPSVLRLHQRVRSVKPTVRFSRRNIYHRDNYKCQYCGHRFKPAELTYDHVRPRSKRGPTTWTNIVTCCVACNRRKANKTPEQAGMRLLQEPMRPQGLSPAETFGRSGPPPSWLFYLWTKKR